jgi:O-antigen/teichoic acid export membrane protein
VRMRRTEGSDGSISERRSEQDVKQRRAPRGPEAMTAADKPFGEVDTELTERPSPAALPHNRRRIAANFVTQAATGILGLVITILISIYIRRVLGPSAIGQVSWSVAFLGYFALLVNPGLTMIGQRELAKKPEIANELLALVLTLQTVFSLVAYALVVAIAAFDIRGPTVSALLLIQGATLFLTAWNTGWVLQANERMVGPSIASLVINALQLPTLLLFVHQPGDIYLYAFLTLLFPLLGVIYNIWYLSRHGLAKLLWLRPKFAGGLRLLREAWPLGLSQAAVLISLYSGTIILGFTGGDEVVGQYATAYRLMLVATIITAALWNAYFPALARAHAFPAEATALSREYVGLLAWMGLPIAALGWTSGRHVVELMYGSAFAQSGAYFEWLCLNLALIFLNYGIISILVPLGRSTLQFKIAATGAILTLTFSLIAIPLYGSWGAIAAAVAAEAIVLGIGLTVRRRHRLYWHPIWPIIGPPLLCSLAVALAIVALPRSFDRFWWLELLVGAIVLGGCLVIFERRVVMRVIRSTRSRPSPSADSSD